VTAAKLAVGGLALAEITGGFPAVAEATETRPSINWAPIIECESGGNPRATNARSTASGLVQFLDSSWKDYGGGQFSARAKDATPAQQMQIAEAAYQRSGLTPWNASRHCWGGKVDQITRSAPAKPVVDEAKPKATSPRTATGERDRDGRGTYVCDTAHLRFDLCDPDTIGQVFEYPPYEGREGSAHLHAATVIRVGLGELHRAPRRHSGAHRGLGGHLVGVDLRVEPGNRHQPPPDLPRAAVDLAYGHLSAL
jgi:hypothetical protein